MLGTLSLALPLLLLAAVAQATLVPQIRVYSGGPDIVMLLVLAWSVHTELEEGVVWAFLGGILQDLLSAAPTGMSSAGLVLLVFIAAALNRQVYQFGWLSVLGLAALGSGVQFGIALVVLNVAGFTVNPVDGLFFWFLPTLVYNVALILPVYWFVRRVQRLFRRGRQGIA